jgi:hypothetical protein
MRWVKKVLQRTKEAVSEIAAWLPGITSDLKKILLEIILFVLFVYKLYDLFFSSSGMST